MTISPPTLTGFNNNVRYRGMRFHIQTEDSGITRPHITTQLFADGGYVIKSLRTDYAELVAHPDRATLVHRLMRDQHRAMALDLRDGKLDATIDRIAPAPDDAPDHVSTLSSLPISTPPPPLSPAPARPESSLAAPPSEERPSSPECGAGADEVSITVESGTLVAAADGRPAADAAAECPASDTPASSKTAAPAGAASRADAGHHPSGGRAASTPQRPAGTQKPPSARAATRRPASSGHAAPSERPASGKKPRSAARGAITQRPTSSARPSRKRAAASSKRSHPTLSTPPTPSSRRAGRPSPVHTPANGSKSLFGPLPQESLDDALRTYATTVENGPPTRGSK